MVRRAKLTMFLDCTESTTVSELKKMVEGITKMSPEDQRLYKDEQPLDDTKTLGDYGFTSLTARPQSPAMIGLACKIEGSVLDMVNCINQWYQQDNNICLIGLTVSIRD